LPRRPVFQTNIPFYLEQKIKGDVLVMLCAYGCGIEGKYKLKNGKLCCQKSPNQCPDIRKKNSSKTKQTNKFIINANIMYGKCRWCGKESTLPGVGKHELNCYLNPKNIKLCPVCNNPIKDYKNTKTCSCSCANTYFRSGSNNPNWKEDGVHYSSYRSTCFFYYGHKCIICNEENLVTAHHIDGNRNNNKKENLIPLCPTHHFYLHWGFEHLIKDKIDLYIKERQY
jgi:hypothetical protein